MCLYAVSLFNTRLCFVRQQILSLPSHSLSLCSSWVPSSSLSVPVALDVFISPWRTAQRDISRLVAVPA